MQCSAVCWCLLVPGPSPDFSPDSIAAAGQRLAWPLNSPRLGLSSTLHPPSCSLPDAGFVGSRDSRNKDPCEPTHRLGRKAKAFRTSKREKKGGVKKKSQSCLLQLCSTSPKNIPRMMREGRQGMHLSLSLCVCACACACACHRSTAGVTQQVQVPPRHS